MYNQITAIPYEGPKSKNPFSFRYYDKNRVMYVTGDREGVAKQREVKADPKRLFGRSGQSHMPPPPYTVQVQVQRRNPLRQQAQNELFMQAYSMSAQAGQYFPLSVLFELLHVDGKERILPVLKQNEQTQMQMQQMQAQLEQQAAQMQQMAQGMATLQEVNEKLMATQSQRGVGSMYPTEAASDNAIPEGAGM